MSRWKRIYLSGNEEADPVGFPLYVTARYSAAAALQIKDLAPPPSLVWETFGCSFRGKTRFLPELLFLFYPCFADNSKKKEKIRLLKRKD